MSERETLNLLELRRSFNSHLKANFSDCPNVQCCDNENLEDDPKSASENNQWSSARMRKLAKNWEQCLSFVSRASDGRLILRRPSEESSGTTSNYSGHISSAGSTGNESRN